MSSCHCFVLFCFLETLLPPFLFFLFLQLTGFVLRVHLQLEAMPNKMLVRTNNLVFTT